jgi:hypothetical protein
VNVYRPQGELMIHITSLEAYFQAHPPASIKEAQSEIEALTGIRRSETQVREFLKKLHLRYHKVGMILARADPEVQAAYLEQVLAPPVSRSPGGPMRRVSRRCGSFCAGSLSGISMVSDPSFHSGSGGTPAFQCLGGLERPHP